MRAVYRTGLGCASGALDGGLMARLCPAMESDQSTKQAAAMAAAARREREAQALRANLARRKAQLRARDAGAADPPAIGASEGREDGAGQPCR